MSKNQKTTLYLKECMADAFLSLLKEKAFSEIRIEDIVNKAEVGRTTYFRNFSSKQEILVYKLIRLWERYAEEHNIKEQRNFDINNALPFFQYNLEIKDTLKIMYDAGLQSLVFESFTNIMLPADKADAKKCYREKFYSYGLFGLLDDWINRDFKETPEEMADYLREFVKNTSPH